MITIIGLGPGNPAHMTVGALEELRSGRPVLLRTAVHPSVPALSQMGIAFDTCDDLYQGVATFDAVYAAIAERVLAFDDLVFAVPGHPLVAEESVRLLRDRAPERIEIEAGTSFLDTVIISLGIDPVEGLELLDGLQLERRMPSGDLPALILQVYSQAVASDVKLTLMGRYPDDHRVVLVRAAGVPGEERREELPLHELDRHPWVDYLTTLYLPPMKPTAVGETNPSRWIAPRWAADPLVEVMARLRGQNGCPWDLEQTHKSLRKYMLEEAYEVVEAIDSGEPDLLREELGDVLLQVVFHAQIAQERGAFDFRDVVAEITEKLLRRHPHVFGSGVARTPDEVTRTWEAIKRTEKGNTEEPRSALDGVPTSAPGLQRAYEVQRKAAKVGFDWGDLAGPVQKVHEELDELLAAAEPAQREGELGDLLFAVVNVARVLKIDPEVALTGTIATFIRRFRHMEVQASRMSRSLAEMTLREMDQLWDEVKGIERNKEYREK